MAKREFLMLAHVRKPDRDYIGGWYMSEKLDGYRCFWDGGITRGLRASQVPWANTDKHARLRSEPIATGLWTRYGQPIAAPDFWINSLPTLPLDGELTLGRGTHQNLASVVKTTTYAHADWEKVRYAVFESPCLATVFADGNINGTFYKKKFSGIVPWLEARNKPLTWSNFERPFYAVYGQLGATDLGEYGYRLEQKVLSSRRLDAEAEVEHTLIEVEKNGGEGLMLRNGISFWMAERSHALLKVKTYQDDDGIVIGYKWAKPTDLERSITGRETNKLLGLMGSLRVRLRSGITFDLSGFTDDERRLFSPHMTEQEVRDLGATQPGLEVPVHIYNPTFPRGENVTFRFRELTREGVPKEARYWRKRGDLS